MNLKYNSILVVDDDEAIRFTLSEGLKKDGYEVIAVSNAEEAIKRIKKEHFPVVIMDVKMPKMNGIEALIEINRIAPKIYPIILTAYGQENLAIGDIAELAFSYLTKPFDLTQLRLTIRQVMERAEVEFEQTSSYSHFPFKEIIGEGPAMSQIRHFILKVAKTPVTVLIQGESGTGKELVAKAIHYCSPRKNKPFIPITCSAIPETLLESELFGYEKGAFTDAKESKPGKFELANFGTLFLDEIADMSFTLQAKLLRVLEERRIERLGATDSLPVDVRIIAATNKDLFQEVKEKRFREDLYYRLNVVPIYLPPLRKRQEDIPLLLEHLIKRFNQELKCNIQSISIEALELLVNYPWPGNVRELENILKHAMVFETGSILSKESLASLLKDAQVEKEIDLKELDSSLSLSEVVKRATAEIEKKLIQQALSKNNGNHNLTARKLGISRKTLYNKINEYCLDG